MPQAERDAITEEFRSGKCFFCEVVNFNFCGFRIFASEPYKNPIFAKFLDDYTSRSRILMNKILTQSLNNLLVFVTRKN
jgi:hypothetical protein